MSRYMSLRIAWFLLVSVVAVSLTLGLGSPPVAVADKALIRDSQRLPEAVISTALSEEIAGKSPYLGGRLNELRLPDPLAGRARVVWAFRAASSTSCPRVVAAFVIWHGFGMLAQTFGFKALKAKGERVNSAPDGLFTALAAANVTGLSAVAGQHCTLALYPESQFSDYSFNAGQDGAAACCGQASRSGAKDVQFAAALVEGLHRFRLPVMTGGFSDGAMLSYRLACGFPKLAPLIASDAGTVMIPTCSGGGHFFALEVHGSSDSFVRITGPPITVNGITLLSLDPVLHSSWRNDVVLHEIVGLNHIWPRTIRDSTGHILSTNNGPGEDGAQLFENWFLYWHH